MAFRSLTTSAWWPLRADASLPPGVRGRPALTKRASLGTLRTSATSQRPVDRQDWPGRQPTTQRRPSIPRRQCQQCSGRSQWLSADGLTMSAIKPTFIFPTGASVSGSDAPPARAAGKAALRGVPPWQVARADGATWIAVTALPCRIDSPASGVHLKKPSAAGVHQEDEPSHKHPRRPVVAYVRSHRALS